MDSLTRSTFNIVEGELSDSWVQLHQQRQRLANASGTTEHSYFRCLEGVVRSFEPEKNSPVEQLQKLSRRDFSHMFGRGGESSPLASSEY